MPFLLRVKCASRRYVSEVVARWLFMLHMARVFGLPMKIFVSAMGLGTTALSVTGVYIWLKKRTARRRRSIGDAQRHRIEQHIAAE
jgi:uncharacterized iron-regulated membrane protein